uniref:Uncharacterized protein n=1 Tax=Anopheles maculatus TaxID=74869 RepID=A0A182SDU1_9DIPT
MPFRTSTIGPSHVQKLEIFFPNGCPIEQSFSQITTYHSGMLERVNKASKKHLYLVSVIAISLHIFFCPPLLLLLSSAREENPKQKWSEILELTIINLYSTRMLKGCLILVGSCRVRVYHLQDEIPVTSPSKHTGNGYWGHSEMERQDLHNASAVGAVAAECFSPVRAVI